MEIIAIKARQADQPLKENSYKCSNNNYADMFDSAAS